MTNVKKIKTAKNLNELLETILSIYQDGQSEEIQMDNLPVFGGKTPDNTAGVWSWDETHLLVGDSGFDDLRIVKRND
jgi:hypothetical protein